MVIPDTAFSLEQYVIETIPSKRIVSFTQYDFMTTVMLADPDYARLVLSVAKKNNNVVNLQDLVRKINAEYAALPDTPKSKFNLLTIKYGFDLTLTSWLLYVLQPSVFLPYSQKCILLVGANHQVPTDLHKESTVDALWSKYVDYVDACHKFVESATSSRELTNMTVIKFLMSAYNSYRVKVLVDQVNGQL